MTIAAVVLMSKVADIENRSMWRWGVGTLLLCVASMFFLPWPLVRVGIAAVASFAAMFISKIIAER